MKSQLQNSLWSSIVMICSPVRFCRKLTYSIENRRLAAKSESGEKSAKLSPNGVLQLALKNIALFLVSIILFSGCGYRFEDQDERLSLSIPYVRGDNEGQLTNELIRQFAYSGGYTYVKDGGNLLLKVVIIGDGTEKIGYRYDRNEFTGELLTNLLATENRRIIRAEVTLVNSPTDEILIGPYVVEASSDYDYTDVNSIQDLAFTTPSGKLETVLNFSLGQVDSVEGAQDTAIVPIYTNLAKKIVAAVLNYSSSSMR